MKIVHIITSLGFGGAEKLLVNVANKQSLEHDVSIIYFKSSDLVQEFHEKINIYQASLNLQVFKKVKEILKSINPNIVHTHLTHADLIGLMASKGLKNAKTFCTIHNTKYKHNFFDNFYYLLYAILFNIISRKTTVIAISKKLIEIINKQLLVNKERIQLLYNSVPSIESKKDKSEILDDLSINGNNLFKVLFVGRLTKQKSVDTLIKAVNSLPNPLKQKVVVFLLGEGNLRPQLEALVREYELETQIIFKGNVANTEDYFKIADIFVLPSLFEGLPLVVLEAMSAGLPIISSKIEGPIEVITERHSGLFFEKQNYLKLAEKITELFHNDVLRNELSNNAKLYFEQKFDLDSYIKTLEGIYKD